MGGIFIAQTWLATDLAAGMNFKSADTAFYEIAEAAGGQWLSMLTAVATALAWGVTVSITSQAAVSRLLYSMARDGRLRARWPGSIRATRRRTSACTWWRCCRWESAGPSSTHRTCSPHW